MMLIVGLGNPGDQYAQNRHNAGFQVLSALARRHGLDWSGKRSNARLAEGLINGTRVALARPQTYMNDSGQAVSGLVRWFKLDPASELLVVYDDLDLPFGTVRVRGSGGAGGQRGMQSIITLMGAQQFPRVRCGIGRPPPGWEVVKYVLGNWSAAEREHLPAVYERAMQACELFLRGDFSLVMNTINSAPALLPEPQP